MIKYLKNLFKSNKQQCNISVVSNSVICDGCNDYGYITVTFGGHSAEMRCLKCDGKSNSNSILNISSQNYGDDGVGLTSEQIDEIL